MSTNFCASLDKMYILNPSSGLDFSWSVISSMHLINKDFMDSETKEKIEFLNSSKFKKML